VAENARNLPLAQGTLEVLRIADPVIAAFQIRIRHAAAVNRVDEIEIQPMPGEFPANGLAPGHGVDKAQDIDRD
jgi:hypothetical protein